MKAVLAAVVLLAIALSADAEMLVYKGTEHHFGVNDGSATTARSCYLVINLATKEVGFITYFTAAGKKHRIRGKALVTHSFPLQRPDGKTVATYSYAMFTDLGNGAFSNESLFLHGLLATVTVGVGATDQQPKTLTGTYSVEGVGIGARYEENSLALSFDQAHTVGANISSSTTDAELTTLEGIVAALGYQ